MAESRQIVWFRSDLRVHDNPALYNACKAGNVVAVYILFPGQWEKQGDSANKLSFWMDNLGELKTQLQKLNIPLLVFQQNYFDETSDTLLKLAKLLKCDGIWFNDEYGVYEEHRDQQVEESFEAEGVNVHRFISQTLVKPGTLKNKQGSYFKVFTPFKRAIFERFTSELLEPLPAPAKQNKISSTVTNKTPGFRNLFKPTANGLKQCWPAGEQIAHQRLTEFINDQAENYKAERDIPSIDGTSSLSPYLVAGVLSLRQCLHAAWQANNTELDTGNEGLVCWIGELIWREFYKHILHGYPRVSKHQAFVTETERLPWRTDQPLLQRWQNGETGIPLVDAAMKQLVETGWMHNRLRMVTAMFLSKNLMLDWRLGEAFFMKHLIDGDLSANNGGWQWSASTGTDAAPYFRMFNPVSQSKKFDAEGVFIRRWLPQLDLLNNKEIHAPWLSSRILPDYPESIVDLAESRKQVLAAFKNLKQL